MGRPCKGENCRVNRQTVEGTELQSKQAKIGRERVAEYTGRGWKGESCRVYRQRVERRESCRVNRQTVEGREFAE